MRHSIIMMLRRFTKIKYEEKYYSQLQQKSSCSWSSKELCHYLRISQFPLILFPTYNIFRLAYWWKFDPTLLCKKRDSTLLNMAKELALRFSPTKGEISERRERKFQYMKHQNTLQLDIFLHLNILSSIWC